MPPGYGPWPLTDAELKQKYLKFDLPTAKKLMADAGFAKGFSVTMTTFASRDYPQVSAVVQSHLKAINVDVNIVAQEAGTFAANNGAGKFDWDLTGRGMRGDVDGYVAEFHPAAPVFKIWYPEYKNAKAWRGIGNGRIQLDPAKRLPIYTGGAEGAAPQPGADPARRDQEVPGRAQARRGHVRRLQRLQHGASHRVAERVRDATSVDPEGRRCGGAPPIVSRPC